MKWAGPTFVVLAALMLPLSAPAGWIRGGYLPEIAVLATLYVGFRGTGERAAWFGVILGLLAAPWTSEPPLLRATVLGTVGLVAGQAGGVVDRERIVINAALAAVASLVLRGTEELALGTDAGTPGSAAAVAGAILVATAVTGVAAPIFFAVVERLGLLAPLERSFRDV
jgi:hypothetical protein